MLDIRLWHLRLQKLRWVLRQQDRSVLLHRGIAPALEHLEILNGRHFATVVDVGANVGQFALFALEQLAPQQLVCIEPQHSPLGHVAGRAATAGCEFTVLDAALSDRRGEGTLRRTNASDSSSLLVPADEAAAQHRGLRVAETLRVPLRTGDELLAEDLSRPILLKIDVQGTELDALRGAAKFLQRVDAVLIEVSFSQLYEGQSAPQDVMEFLFDRGFGLAAIAAVPGGGTGWKMAQTDILFNRVDAE